MSSFTLLDDSAANTAHPTSRLYTDFHAELICNDVAGFDALLKQLQAALTQGLYAVGIFSYELGIALQGLANGIDQATPSRILLYRNCQQLDRIQVDDWLQQQCQPYQVAGLAQLYSNVDENHFTQAIGRIQQYIANGDTYQVNYTFRFHFQTYGHFCALYQRLRARQSVPFGALIALPDGTAVLSLSPELFIRHSHGTLQARPMKGTAAAHTMGTVKENDRINAQLAAQLTSDIKTRAENLMIVDLLRNDLSRIAELSSVQVPELFHVQRFDSVLQMTSTITATLKKDVTLK